MKRLGVDTEIRSHKAQSQTNALTGHIERIGAVCHILYKKTFHFGNAFTLEKQMLEVFA